MEECRRGGGFGLEALNVAKLDLMWFLVDDLKGAQGKRAEGMTWCPSINVTVSKIGGQYSISECSNA